MIKTQKYDSYFYAFLVVHIVVWTLLPTLLRDNLPLDAIEAISWGYEWQFGYLKHPPFSAWLAEGMFRIFPGQWSIYFLSQLCVGFALLATWKLAKDFLPINQALMAVLLLESVYYYNFTSIEFNANIALLPLWAWSSLYFWRVTKNPDSLANWLILSVFCALALLAKYYAIMLLASMFLFLIYDKNLRKTLLTPHPYLAAILVLAILSPHISWLINHDFEPFVYAKNRSSADHYHFYNHLLHPLSFVLAQIASLSFALILFFNANRQVRFEIKKETKSIFLLFIGLMPFALTLFYSLLTGGKLRDMWGSMMWSSFGIILFYFFRPKISEAFQKRFYGGLAIVALIAVFILIAAHLVRPHKYGHFDGKLLVEKISQNHPGPIENVFGDVWLTGNMNFYSNPRVHVIWDLEEFSKKGGILLWNANNYEGDLTHYYLTNISAKVEIQEPIILPYLKFNEAKPYRVGWAMVAPH